MYAPGAVEPRVVTDMAVVLVVEPLATLICVVVKATVAPMGNPATLLGTKLTGPLNPFTGLPVIVTAGDVVPAFAVTEAGDGDKAKSATTKLTDMVWMMFVFVPVPLTLIA